MLIQNFPPWFWSWLGPLVWPWSFWDTFSETLAEASDGWEGYCLVQRIEGVRVSRGGIRVALTLHGSSDGDTHIERIYISRADPNGKPYDSDSDLTAITSLSTPVPKGATVIIPPVNYQVYKGEPLLLAIDFSVAPSSNISCNKGVPTGQACAYYNTGAWAAIKDRAATAAAQSLPEFTKYPGVYVIEKIKVSVGLTGGWPP
jgi:hypothetical protein